MRARVRVRMRVRVRVLVHPRTRIRLPLDLPMSFHAITSKKDNVGHGIILDVSSLVFPEIQNHPLFFVQRAGRLADQASV